MDPQFMLNQVVTADEAADLIKDGDAVIVGGSGGMGAAESLLEAIENRFLDGVAQQPKFEAVGGVHPASHGLIYGHLEKCPDEPEPGQRTSPGLGILAFGRS